MFDYLRSVKWSLLLIGIINIVLGVTMVIYPDTASDVVVKVMGALLAIFAIVTIFGYLVDKKKGLTAYTSLVVGAFMLIIGALLFFDPARFEEFLGYIFAVLMLVQGVNLIVEGFATSKYKASHWVQTLIMGLICVALAIVIFINPFNTVRALMLMTGISMIISGVLCIIVAGRIGSAVHTMNKAVKEAERAIAEEAKLVEMKEEAVDADVVDAVEAEVVESKIPETLDEIKLDLEDHNGGVN